MKSQHSKKIYNHQTKPDQLTVKGQDNRIKQHHLQMYKTAYQELQHSFKNNLNVIKQLQQENTLLQQHLAQFQLQYEHRLQTQIKQSQMKNQQELMKQEMNFGRQIQLIKKEYEDFISTINQNTEHQNEQLIKALSKKHKMEIKQVSANYGRQIQQLTSQIKKLQKQNASLQENIIQAQDKANNGQLRILNLQTQLQKAQKQKFETQTLYTGYQQQLQTLKQSNNSWQGMLKQRIKQLEQEKCNLEEEMTECKFLNKEKQKKLVAQHNKKITQLEQVYSVKMNDMLRESKEIKFRFQKIKEENIQLKGEVDKCRRELVQTVKQLQTQQSKYVTAQDSMVIMKEKQYQLSSAQEQIKRLKGELVAGQQQGKLMKEQLRNVNYQRETAQKALERLKIELLNKSKQVQQAKKQLSKAKYYQQINYQPQQNRGAKQNNVKNKKSNEQQPGAIDYSRCFTQDMGPIDENFFLPNSSIGQQLMGRQFDQISQQYHHEEPTHERKRESEERHTITQLMKRIGELQVQCDQYKAVIKNIKEEMERAAVIMDDKVSLKDRQIKLGKQENIMLRERLNSKQQQIMNMKQSLQKYKQQQASFEDINKKKYQLEREAQQNRKIHEQNKQLRQKVQQLQEEIEYLKKERQTLQEIADQLKAEVQELRQELMEFKETGYEKNYGNVNVGSKSYLRYNTEQDNLGSSYQSYQNSIKTHINNFKPIIQHQNNLISSKHQQSIEQYKIHQHSRSKSKSPKQNINIKSKEPFSKSTGVKRKLHELIKQKNTLEMQNTPIIGRKANIQKRNEQERTQHVGTKSQKQVYQRLQRMSKSRSKQKLQTKLKDYQIPQSLLLNSKQSFEKESQPGIQPSHPQDQRQHELDEQLQHEEFNKRIEMINRLREEIKNDSLGEFDHLQNVSLTYWDQQV